jgi:medium-chain acyl-[acyl-carrier-protein] hydrolase
VYPVPGDERRWLKRPVRGSDAAIRLFCFHYAGGSAAMFRNWHRRLPQAIEPVAVQLPGRADRFGEPPYDDMAQLVDRLVDVIKPLLDQPFAFFGWSMGARVSWALAHALRDRSMPMPRKLFVASSEAPRTEKPVRGWNEPDSGLVAYLRELGGTPPEILADSYLLARLLPTLRADLTVLASHFPRPTVPLDVPIHAIAGRDDLESPPSSMRAWRAETSAASDMDVIAAGHFFDADAEGRVIGIIGAGLP